MIMYRARIGMNEVETVEVVSATAKTVTVKEGYRQFRQSEYHFWSETYEGAARALAADAAAKAEKAEKQARYYRDAEREALALLKEE